MAFDFVMENIGNVAYSELLSFHFYLFSVLKFNSHYFSPLFPVYVTSYYSYLRAIALFGNRRDKTAAVYLRTMSSRHCLESACI
jgi:hypothetical protein